MKLKSLRPVAHPRLVRCSSSSSGPGRLKPLLTRCRRKRRTELGVLGNQNGASRRNDLKPAARMAGIYIKLHVGIAMLTQHDLALLGAIARQTPIGNRGLNHLTL